MAGDALIGKGPAHGQVGFQVGQSVAQRLKVADRLAKGLAFGQVGAGDVMGLLRGGE